MVATAWVISHVPSTFRRITVRKPLGVMSSAGAMYWPPALLTQQVDAPVALDHAVDERVDLVLLADVALRAPRSGPSSHSATVSSSGSSRRPHTTTCAPSAVSSTAVARPRPRAAAGDDGDLAGEQVGGEDAWTAWRRQPTAHVG